MELTLIASAIVLASGVDHCRVDVAGVDVDDRLDEVVSSPSLALLRYKQREAANSFGPAPTVISENTKFLLRVLFCSSPHVEARMRSRGERLSRDASVTSRFESED